MKILQVLGGGAWGGGSVVVLSIVKQLIARGDEVWVIALDDETAHHFRSAGAVPVSVPCWLRPVNPLDAVPLFFLWQLCRREKFDLVSTHTSKGGMLGRLAAKLAGVPAITHHVHGFGFHQFTHPLVKQVYVMFEKLGARCHSLMITVGEQHREFAMELGIEKGERIRTILNGIQVEKFLGHDRAAIRAELGFGEDEVILGSIGRLATQKGFAYMIEAMPAIVAKNPRARLVIAGIGDLDAELTALVAAKGMEKHVTFLGFRRDAPRLLAAFDVFVHPSLWEGLSISLMEAMVAGCPIVCSRIPGNIEMIDDGRTGIFSEPASPESIVASVNRMLADPAAARRMAETAQREGMERFPVERMVRENVAAYDSVAPARKQPIPINRKREDLAA